MSDQHETHPIQANRPGPSVIQRRLAPELPEHRDPTGEIHPIPGKATTGFNAHAGEVMANPRVFAIYWGRGYGSPHTGMNELAATFDRFFTEVMNSVYMDPLAQYLVGRGTFIGSTWIDHAPGRAQTLDEGGLSKVLATWIDDGITPEVPEPHELNLLFVIFTPPEITLTVEGKSGGFCAYHASAYYQKSSLLQKANLFFAAVTTGSNTATVAHELVEAFTDRSGNGWYSDDGDNPEIGDVCSSCGSRALTLGGFQLASYWLVEQGRCLQQTDITPPPPLAVPRVIGFTAAEAWKTLQADGFLVHQMALVDPTYEHIGKVISQFPAGGSTSHKEAAVTIWVGARPPHPRP